MKIAFIANEMTHRQIWDQIDRQYQLSYLQMGQAVTDYDLVIFDAALDETDIRRQPCSCWMIVNADGIQDSLHYYQIGAVAALGGKYDANLLQQCWQTVESGNIYLPPELLQILAMRQIKKMLSPFSRLTSREFDIFCLLAEDFEIAEIAENLGVSEKTAFNCQTNIKTKLKVKNKLQMNQCAQKNGLI